ncbi:LysM peptidoglycan-binding domain-containing protein [Marispirochaeta aestuarii]|uniref:LysM peptidoglycan-binding domain-containing protein n=1 Tax=Marispirochaeta aestuarii TaxID=1963862 RepID=UPI0029C6F9AA|nr:LysM peptidoglycan-binding domain-containing protein [Marispirochaeta aestuarii]
MKRRHLISCMILCICAAAGADVYHTIKPGETLYRLSREYGISVDELKTVNDIDDVSDIRVGTRLLIRREQASSSTFETYTVEKGDTLYRIARNNGMSLSELLQLNDLNEDHMLRVGEVLKIGTTEENSESGVTNQQAVAVNQPENGGDNGSEDGNTEFFWPHQGERISLNGKLVGKEIKGVNGDPVVSVSSGKVIWVAPYHGYGKIIMVEAPDKHIFAYGGNGDTLVNVGDNVRPGQKLGLLGAGGSEGAAKAFFFVYRNGKPVDPESAPRK